MNKNTDLLPVPGVYYNIPNHDYHSWPYVSSTLLKAYDKLPSTCRIPFMPGDDANVGSGVHAFVLEGQKGLGEQCILGPAYGKGKADMAAREALQAENPGKVILPAFYGSPAPGQPIMDVLNGVNDSLRNHPKIGPVLANSEKEVSLVWIDECSGLTCKARLDIWDGQIIWDLKKVRSISGFPFQMKELGYHIQAGFYYEGAKSCGLEAVAFGFIPVEAFPPYQAACGYVDPDRLEAARANAKRLVGLVKESQLTDVWPNYRIPEHIFSLADIVPDDLVAVY